MERDNFEKDNKGSLLLDGSVVRGNIDSERDICLKGAVKGNIRCGSQLSICKGALVEGEIFCRSLWCEGLIVGSAEVTERARLGETAVIKGHLVTSSLSVHPGAMIEQGLKFKDNIKK